MRNARLVVAREPLRVPTVIGVKRARASLACLIERS